MTSSSKKRSRSEADKSRAECPFSIKLVDPKEEQKSKRRRKPAEDDETKKTLTQPSPFAPTGKFKTYDTMDGHYQVEPAKKWADMTPYNSFVLNGAKYFSGNFIYVANDSSLNRQKAPRNKEGGLKKSDEDWVAMILEIRASDEHHVYARVYWMYWPDELPPHTLDGKKMPQGRQPYHGQMELVASNHMDMISVVSVTSQAHVNQMIEDNDDDIQSSLYWRQAFDVRTAELSVRTDRLAAIRGYINPPFSHAQSVELVCRCGQPANPDKTLIGCSNTKGGCGKWLHSDCLIHDALIRVYERLGETKPHITQPTLKDGKGGDEAKRPLSPKESGGAVSAQQSIDVKSNGVDVKDIKPNSESARLAESPTAPPTSTEPEAKSIKKSTSTEPSWDTASRTGRKGKFKKKREPYEWLFHAKTVMTLTPPLMEITDLRKGIEGGDKTWMEPMPCPICHVQIV
ncbi:hypothetical protein RB601_003635 [Gaeumannomyces tritici]